MTAVTQTITTTIADLLNAEPALARVLKVRLDARTRYHVVKLARLVQQETKHFYDERTALIKELGIERQPTGAERARFGPEPISEVAPANMKTYLAKVKEIQAVPVTLAWGPLTTAMIEKFEDITGEDCAELGPLFELDPPTPTDAT